MTFLVLMILADRGDSSQRWVGQKEIEMANKNVRMDERQALMTIHTHEQ